VPAACDAAAVCTSVCTPLDEADLEAAIASLTRALAAADDHALAVEFVRERRAMREELRAMREARRPPAGTTGVGAVSPRLLIAQEVIGDRVAASGPSPCLSAGRRRAPC